MLSLFCFKLVYLQSLLAICYVDIILVNSDVICRLTFANMCKNNSPSTDTTDWK